MKLQNAWSRRSFLSAVAATGAAAVATKLHLESAKQASGAKMGSHFAFVGDANNSVTTYRVENGGWQQTASFAAENPRAITLHPALPVLYVAHSTEIFDMLPRGSVSAMAIDSATGALTPMGREGTALSATHPEHLATSPDGRTLLVAAHSGGAYNLFALNDAGALTPVPSPLKQTGVGPHPAQQAAHPYSLAYRADGAAAYSTDFGADRVNHLRRDGDGLTVASRLELAAGSGPAEMVLHPNGSMLMVANRLHPSVTIVHIDKASGELKVASHNYKIAAETVGPIALNERGSRLYVASTLHTGEAQLTAYGVAGASGRLQEIAQQTIAGVGRPVEMIHMGDHLLLAGDKGIAHVAVDAESGNIADVKMVVEKPGTVSLAVLSA
jgi:6-phosphogluconolactonase